MTTARARALPIVLAAALAALAVLPARAAANGGVPGMKMTGADCDREFQVRFRSGEAVHEFHPLDNRWLGLTVKEGPAVAGKRRYAVAWKLAPGVALCSGEARLGNGDTRKLDGAAGALVVDADAKAKVLVRLKGRFAQNVRPRRLGAPGVRRLVKRWSARGCALRTPGERPARDLLDDLVHRVGIKLCGRVKRKLSASLPELLRHVVSYFNDKGRSSAPSRRVAMALEYYRAVRQMACGGAACRPLPATPPG